MNPPPHFTANKLKMLGHIINPVPLALAGFMRSNIKAGGILAHQYNAALIAAALNQSIKGCFNTPLSLLFAFHTHFPILLNLLRSSSV